MAFRASAPELTLTGLSALGGQVRESGITILVVTHEHDIAEKTDRTIRLRDGVVVDAAAAA